MAMLLQSCATVFSGTVCKVKVNAGSPENAKVYMNGSYVDNAPCHVKVSKNGLKSGQTKITIKADGYKDQDITLVKKLKGGALFGDILLGFWPLVIDFGDGAIYKAYPDNIKYNLAK